MASCANARHAALACLTTAAFFLPVAGASKAAGFPKDFLFGSATAAYQCEGAYREDGRGPSIWDVFSHLPGKTNNGDTGDVADDQYHRYMDDIELMDQTGFDFYRFSISPTRILPTGKLPVNKAGIEHYNQVIDALIKKGIKPFVTLYHWDYPQELDASYGGWLSPNSTFDFLTYAEICFKAFGDRVSYWLTFNEPWTFAFQGYNLGIHAPGRCSDRSVCDEGDSATEPYIVAHNVLRTHAYTVKLFREKYQKKLGGQIGITLNTDWAEPYSKHPDDLEAAERNMLFMFGWFAHPVFFGDYPKVMHERIKERLPKFNKSETELLKGSLDFLGLNHYGSHYTMDLKKGSHVTNLNFKGWIDDMGVNNTFFRDGKPIGKAGDSDWLYAAPWGFYKLLLWVNQTYSPDTIIVTENGMDVKGESDLPLAMALQDTDRRDYYREYIGAMKRALREGVPVKGYTAWSMLDNFEWADGYSKRFGLFYVDYAGNLTRYAKSSAQWFRSFLAGEETAPVPHSIPGPIPHKEKKKDDSKASASGGLYKNAKEDKDSPSHGESHHLTSKATTQMHNKTKEIGPITPPPMLHHRISTSEKNLKDEAEKTSASNSSNHESSDSGNITRKTVGLPAPKDTKGDHDAAPAKYGEAETSSKSHTDTSKHQQSMHDEKGSAPAIKHANSEPSTRGAASKAHSEDSNPHPSSNTGVKEHSNSTVAPPSTPNESPIVVTDDNSGEWVYLLAGIVGIACTGITIAAGCIYYRKGGSHPYDPIPSTKKANKGPADHRGDSSSHGEIARGEDVEHHHHGGKMN
mmetsp:Transcript_16418/g.22901  ORF Transcript_16418/g.22901 Transcript_16418/m.22901 type:complete len:801 (-) Transcript_16418:372-2774(-)|eukprot:CAMPEP_0184488184 /NCGR_PEP_ID=MMETSP0113_2-20130426/10577_1 /TAXON_ID=91329 /ORGANISM="Norrisiella sphaerica, Strain BC52" /LENGTH=800 /DNA_ID=CAMNT_0026870679 /DNA_START=238 /DNA_END=2640 /DNA_ORIENTATION=-